MLILSRKESQQLVVGDNIIITVVRVSNDRVRIGVVAPNDVKVLRLELEEGPTILQLPTIEIVQEEKKAA